MRQGRLAPALPMRSLLPSAGGLGRGDGTGTAVLGNGGQEVFVHVIGDYIGKSDAFLVSVDPLELNLLVAREIPACRDLDPIRKVAHDMHGVFRR